MHRKLPISVLVYQHLFPHPRPEDPSSFSAHLSKNLVGEVRIETATFYGSLDTIEARYPGLNYSHGPHRKRLARFPHHARLFRAFDELRLTESEIASLCRWEGTLWARQRYERDEGIKVLDTTGNEIGPWRGQPRRTTRKNSEIKVKTDIEVEIEDVRNNRDTAPAGRIAQQQAALLARQQQATDAEDEDMEDDSDEEIESIGIPLNQRLIEAAARREQGAANVMMDADWEKYLERGDYAASSAAHVSQLSLPSIYNQNHPPAPPSASA
ncbi:hypothetical protein HDK90DRAFT_340324 [Phyllosticta capitalensis]|uniref:Uncharacterized protein n=1 Tax=Phyllosticta capitalensis TaxID=121624 RepID=A0ABR1YFS9_9PEZI